MNNRVVVTGVGIVCPLGIHKETVWRRLLAGDHGIQKLTADPFKSLPSRIAGVVPEEDLDEAASGLKSHPRFIQFALIAADLALKDARLAATEDAGVSFGSGMSCVDEVWKEARTMETKGPRRVSPHFVPRILGNMAGGHISMKYGLRGPFFSPSTACATGASAIGEAFRAIKHGYAKTMLAGAAEACIDPLSLAGFSQARALCTHSNDAPGEASRPFDRQRAGFVMGEGGAVLVLEELSSALSRGAPIVAEVVGYGPSSDAHHITASHPDGLGARLAMSRALNEAAIDSSLVGYINAHGTSTPLGDRAELLAISKMFPHDVTVSSTKGATGHLLSGAGAVEAAFTCLALSSVFLFRWPF